MAFHSLSRIGIASHPLQDSLHMRFFKNHTSMKSLQVCKPRNFASSIRTSPKTTISDLQQRQRQPTTPHASADPHLPGPCWKLDPDLEMFLLLRRRHPYLAAYQAFLERPRRHLLSSAVWSHNQYQLSRSPSQSQRAGRKTD